MNTKKAILISFILIMLLVMIRDNDTAKLDEIGENSVPYEILKIEDISIPQRSRYKCYIVAPEAKTRAQLGATVTTAARNVCNDNNADTVLIVLEPKSSLTGMGRSLAFADYTPDRLGNSGKEKSPLLVLSVCDEVPTSEELNILEAWEKNKGYFKKDGLTDEMALTNYLKKEFNLSEISLPFIYAKEYLVID